MREELSRSGYSMRSAGTCTRRIICLVSASEQNSQYSTVQQAHGLVSTGPPITKRSVSTDLLLYKRKAS
jgi:hypothetical protein